MSLRAWTPSISAPAAADEASQARAMLPARTASRRMRNGVLRELRGADEQRMARLELVGRHNRRALPQYQLGTVFERMPGISGRAPGKRLDGPRETSCMAANWASGALIANW